MNVSSCRLRKVANRSRSALKDDNIYLLMLFDDINRFTMQSSFRNGIRICFLHFIKLRVVALTAAPSRSDILIINDEKTTSTDDAFQKFRSNINRENYRRKTYFNFDTIEIIFNFC